MDQRQLAKKSANALERLEVLERTVNSIGSATNNNINQIGGMTEVLDAVVQILGVEAIQKVLSENRVAMAEAQSKAEEEALKELLSKGDIAESEKISDKSIVVGKETNPDGTVRPPGRAQVAFARIDPTFQEQFLGKSAGFVLDLPTGGKFEVLSVYDVVEKAETPVIPAPVTTEPTAEA